MLQNYIKEIQNIPVLGKNSIVKEALVIMTEKSLGALCLIDDDGRLCGIFTDGDLRRFLLKTQQPISALLLMDVFDVCSKNCKSIDVGASLDDVKKIMIDCCIFDLPVTQNNKLIGIIHLQDIL